MRATGTRDALWLSERLAHAHGLCWAGMIASLLLVLTICRAHAGHLFCVLPLVRSVAAQDFSPTVRWNVAGGGSLGCFLRRAGFGPAGARKQTFACEPLPAGNGNVFRTYFERAWRKILGEIPQWRNFTALDEYYHERPAANLDRWHLRIPHWFPCGDFVLERWRWSWRLCG